MRSSFLLGFFGQLFRRGLAENPSLVYNQSIYNYLFDNDHPKHGVYNKNSPPIRKDDMTRYYDGMEEFEHSIDKFVDHHCDPYVNFLENFANLDTAEAQLIYNKDTLECFKRHRKFSKYNECLSQGTNDAGQMRDPDLAKEAEIDACSWNYFEGITAGSQGVNCRTLDELRAYANEMETGQKISCKRYLKVKLLYDLNATRNNFTSMSSIFYHNAWSTDKNNKVSEMFDVIWDYGDLPFKGEFANPIQIDTWLQVQAVNDISIAEEYMDITVVMSMTWRDVRLSWDLLSWDYMNNIWVDSDLIWTPNLHFSNRVQDFGPLQEVTLRSNIGFDGKVTNYRSLRLRASYTSDSTMFPYDTQETMLQIQSRDYSNVYIEITTDSMNRAYGIDPSSKGVAWTNDLYTMQNDLYSTSTSWDWQRVGYEIGETQSQLRNNEKISTLNIFFEFRRFKPFVDLTLYTPIYVLLILLPLGVLIPVQSGEKMGFQITLLLATFFYVDYFQANMPTFSAYDESPLILNFFVAFMFIQLVTVIVSIYSIYLSSNIDKITAYHKRFSRIVGRSTCGWWTMPPNMEKYYDPQYDLGDAEDKYDEEEEVKFYLDMQDKFLFMIIGFALFISWGVTILRSLVEQA